MKRRNVEIGKRRPVKRTNKFTESVYGSSFVYAKFFMIWCIILLADFIMEVRFEYLWPFWLLLRSVCDSFKYQGLAFSVFFVCVAITSDVICLLFIPLDWIFFMASTYVWVQYVWHTEKGICLPTISLWLFFMYIEAALRLKDFKHNAFPFHVDLCRPFAAHCIGYPVVTLGFGFKGYVSYRLRLRTQHDVQKDNEFYYELIKQALPTELRDQQTYLPIADKDKQTNSILSANSILSHLSLTSSSKKDKEKNQNGQQRPASLHVSNANGTARTNLASNNDGSPGSPVSSKNNNTSTAYNNTSTSNHCTTVSRKIIQHHNNNLQTSEKLSQTTNEDIASSHSELRKRNVSNTTNNGSSSPKANYKKSSNTNTDNSNTNNTVSTAQHAKSPSRSASVSNSPVSNKSEAVGNVKSINTTSDKHKLQYSEAKSKIKQDALKIDELTFELNQVRNDLQLSRQTESKLENQVHSLINNEKYAKNELMQLKSDNDELQTRLHNLVTTKQKDKQSIQHLEKRIKSESELKMAAERQLEEEKKKRVAEEELSREKESMELMKKMFKVKEKELEKMSAQLKESEEKFVTLNNQIKELKEKQKSAKETETLMSALAAMKEKNMMLQKSLSAETRLKLDLFSALGDAKRRMEILNGLIYKRDAEISELKSRVADALSVLPESQVQSGQYNGNYIERQSPAPFSPTQHYSAAFCTVMPPPLECPPVVQNMVPNNAQQQMAASMIHLPLDPTAAMYTPPVTSNMV